MSNGAEGGQGDGGGGQGNAANQTDRILGGKAAPGPLKVSEGMIFDPDHEMAWTWWTCTAALRVRHFALNQRKFLTFLESALAEFVDDVVKVLLRACTKLEHQNLGNVKTIQNYDNVARELANHCRHLKSLNLWRAKTLTHVGLSALSHGCVDLLELDLGWCSELNSSTTCFVNLVQTCRKLRKLILTAIRSVSDNDLYAFASCCPDLEQIDILGTMQVGPHSVDRVFECCKKLRFFDLSFCNRVPNEMIRSWREAYPHVAIKRSFTQASF